MIVLETKPDFLFTEWVLRRGGIIKSREADYEEYRKKILDSIILYLGVSFSEMKSKFQTRKFVYARVMLYHFTGAHHSSRVLQRNYTTMVHYRSVIETEKLYGFDLDVKEITKLILE